MKPSQLYEALHALISERVPLHIWGACGVGKSQIVAQVAADRKCEFLDIRAVQLDPVDLRGLPRISADRAEWVPPKFLPLDGEGILFLDELTELNGLFREEDYPSTEKLRNKFGVRLEVLPIPSGNDFRVTLSEEEQARVAREIDENVRQSLQKGTEDLWTRLKGVVAHMVERLNEPESRFHASLVSNICELVDLLPRLNVNQDEELNRFAGEIRDRLCGFTARDLKKNEILRAATANDAAEILTEMDAVLRERGQLAESDSAAIPASADDIFAHMAAYMEAPVS
jgi:hypothetical protein